MDSPSTPQGRSRELQERSINTLAEQLRGCTISKPKKREQATATPASQARPRTQRRTGEDQENLPAASDPADASTSSAVTPSRLKCYADLQDELSCGICLEICVRPCATPCGHAFCRTCLRQALQHKRQCPKCREVLPTSWQPNVNVALWNTIQLLFPHHAAQAPPPTPPQLQAAAGGGATGRNRGRGGSQGVQVLSSSLPGGVFAAHSQAARQAFRPPRPAGATQEDAPRVYTRTRQQQQHAERFVMPPDLQIMLQGMARANQHASRQAAVASQLRRSSRQQLGNPFPSAVHGASQGQTSISIDIDIEDEVMSQLTGNSSQQPAAQHSRRASSQQAAHATQGRLRQRAAAAARVHAAIAEEEALQDDQEEQDLHAAILASLHDRGSGPGMHPDAAAAAGSTGRLRLAVAVGSEHPQPAAVAAAHGSRSSRSRTLRLQPLRQLNHASSDTDEDFFPDFDVSEISDDDDGIVTGHTTNGQPAAPRSPNRPESASLFGRIHSGRSPQQQWAAPDQEDESDDEWIHDVGALVDELANRTTATAAAALSGSGIAAGVQGTDAAREPSSSQAAAALTTRLQQRQGSSSNNTAAGADDSHRAGRGTNTITADDHQGLLDHLSEFEEDLGPALWQHNRAAGTTTAAGTTAAAASRVRSRAPPAAAVTVQYTSAAAAASPAAAPPVEASVGTDQERRGSSATTSTRSATAQAAATTAGGGIVSRRRGGRARILEDDDAGEPGIGATSATAVGSGGSSSDSANRGAQQSQHDDTCGAAVAVVSSVAADTALAAAAVSGVEEQVVNMDDLVLMPSPEPQPLMARLATFGGHASRQHTNGGAGIADQQRQHSVLSQMVDAALGAGGVAVNSTNTSTVNRSAADASTRDITVADDDFLPTRLNRRGLNAAAAVSAALRHQTGSGSPPRARGRTRAGRVVPGLRRTRG